MVSSSSTSTTVKFDIGQIHRITADEVYELMGTSPSGLSTSEAENRLKQVGPNILRQKKGKPLYLRFLSNFTHLMAILLWVGGLVGFIAQMPQLGVAVWMVNLINGVFSFWQEFRAEKAMEALRKLLPSYGRVLRDGKEAQILSENLVPGDLILVAEGDSISVDCRLVQAAELRVDQSTLTGESRPVAKISDLFRQEGVTRSEIPNLIFAGTSVAVGTGKAVVVATGMKTEFGKIADLTQSVEEELSPLQQEMVLATKIVTVLATSIGAAFFLLAILFAGVTLADSFIFALGMVVAFVPEGMLPLVTLSLAMGTQRMAQRNALIKKLSAVETLGCTSVICTDKTGTLTQNEMTVRNLWLPCSDGPIGRMLSVTGIGYNPAGAILAGDEKLTISSEPGLYRLLRAGSLCNNSRLLPPEEGQGQTEEPAGKWSILGDPTEAAMRVAALKGGMDLTNEENRTPRLREIPFDSRRKRMSTIHSMDHQMVAYTKGAPKEVLELCNQLSIEGQVQPIDQDWRKAIMAANDELARNGLRVLAVAERQLPPDLPAFTAGTVEVDLVFLGLIAMMDPPRPEVTEAVEKCRRAGIRVVMITGDYGLTAESIARKIGIIRKAQPRIVTGFELDAMSEDALQEAMRDELIFARVTPEHKLRVVTAFQSIGHVVAVTGDGVNDAPALKKANIGVAMGLSGTDVAKEAADMILTDDNFASIVNAVEEGRAVYSNIKKFFAYIFTSNAPEAWPFIFFALSRARIPLGLTVMEVLSIDLGTDMVPALALGAELPEPGIMDKPPRSLKEHVLTRSLILRSLVFLGTIQGIAAMAAFYFQYWTHGYWGQFLDLPASGTLYHSATAMALGVVVTTQIGNLFAQRTERVSFFRTKLFKNPLIWAGIATELALVCLLIYTPFFQDIFGTAAIGLESWLFLFAWTPALLLADEVRKAFLRRKDRP